MQICKHYNIDTYQKDCSVTAHIKLGAHEPVGPSREKENSHEPTRMFERGGTPGSRRSAQNPQGQGLTGIHSLSNSIKVSTETATMSKKDDDATRSIFKSDA